MLSVSNRQYDELTKFLINAGVGPLDDVGDVGPLQNRKNIK